MSILDAIANLKTKINNAYTALASKGATIPSQKNIANLASTINTITELKGETKNVTLTTSGSKTINPSSGKNAITSITISPKNQNRTVTPKTTLQTLTINYGYSGNGIITVNPVTSKIDSNIKSQNIREGVTILGVQGNLIEGIHPSGTYEVYSNTPRESSLDIGSYKWLVVHDYEYYAPCFLEGTPINLWDGSKKPIEKITYEDEILCWDFDEARYCCSKPLWIKKEQITDHYWINRFESGKIIRTTGEEAGHRFFNLDVNQFLYNIDCVNNYCYTINCKDKLLESEYVEEECTFYNVYTYFHMNLFANDILTSFRYNNLYPIKDMKFIKDNRKQRERSEFQNIPDSWYYGMRCSEQLDSVQIIEDYVNYRESIKKQHEV